MPKLSKLMRLGVVSILIFALMVGCTTEQSQLNKKTEIVEKPRLEEKDGISSPTNKSEQSYKESLINSNGRTIIERIKVPEGYERVEVPRGSFAEYLRNLPLKPHGTKVKYYNGEEKPNDVYVAVIDMDVGTRDLQQCADAVIRLYSEYLYKNRQYDKIHFNFTNGFRADFKKWMQGYRIKVEGNKTYWIKVAGYDDSYECFRKYLDMVFAYAGTLSLSQEMKRVPLSDLQIGDVFLKGSDPGHCAIVVDVAQNPKTGEKIFLLAQSYMPAQDIHILKNPANEDSNPWYSINFGDILVTPEWQFTKDQVYRFGE
ncbi:hypothetical protein Calkro_1115 [Caldicellulosiruptor kronotskyensis 2002]|uniref:Lipoprotein n=1 Tax=Caldicellulosiruptor kronotskyensis (strain DSM 18902 / VKM B-2412 / 2002) TaxID=632348 RepID=E4SCW5_CALK2|nr:DUF4846 domain-containing protein [Caldicellulosiruptor kronotskyensis]ADQ45981.1 hypothetical protein Calkro_1115 [Caldicellulosiruptor kronotskyensis 2002]